ncbi:HNH endonuclease [bacterium]|nr:HNH endonuclease [bacterium]
MPSKLCPHCGHTYTDRPCCKLSAPRPAYHSLYRSDWWKRVRVQVLATDPVCRVCTNAIATEVDHIIPHRGNCDLFHDLDNLQPICHRCHTGKSGRGG